LLDLKGNLISTKSKKDFLHSEIIRYISQRGTPVIFTTDIDPVPKKLEKISAAFSVILITPGRDMTKKEKNRLLKRYTHEFGIPKIHKKHEKDALASAIYAWKKTRSLTLRINTRISSMDLPRKLKSELDTFVKSNVFTKRLNISRSISEYLRQM